MQNRDSKDKDKGASETFLNRQLDSARTPLPFELEHRVDVVVVVLNDHNRSAGIAQSHNVRPPHLKDDTPPLHATLSTL